MDEFNASEVLKASNSGSHINTCFNTYTYMFGDKLFNYVKLFCTVIYIFTFREPHIFNCFIS